MSAFANSVIPAKAGIHEHGRSKFPPGGVHGSRVKPGMTSMWIVRLRLEDMA
jgi:hypothetical protein